MTPAADRPVRPAEGESSPRPTPRFRLVLETREVQLLEGENVIGRDPDGALWIDHPSVSRRHARIVVAGGKAVLEDLDSKNGTFLGGKRLAKKAALADGDEVRIGPETMVFRAASSATTRTERRELGKPREAPRDDCDAGKSGIPRRCRALGMTATPRRGRGVATRSDQELAVLHDLVAVEPDVEVAGRRCRCAWCCATSLRCARHRGGRTRCGASAAFRPGGCCR